MFLTFLVEPQIFFPIKQKFNLYSTLDLKIECNYIYESIKHNSWHTGKIKKQLISLYHVKEGIWTRTQLTSLFLSLGSYFINTFVVIF